MAEQKMTRRGLLKASVGAAGAVALPWIIPASAIGRDGHVAPSDRVTMAFIGVGNQGTGDMGGFLQDKRVQVVAVCDVNFQSGGYWSGGTAGREPARRMVDEYYEERGAKGPGCKAYVDYHDVLQRSDIDAVEIATPDHWHALCVLHAAAAKKDIYCQKPLALTVKQGRLMSDAVKKHNVIFQTGSQQKSDSNFRRAAELVRNGRIGKLQTVKVGLPSGRPDYGRTADKVTPGVWPDGFEYDRWLGPAQWKPYCAGRTHVNFRWILDYSGGQLTDWGGHHPDCAQWGMGTEYTGPVKIVNAKGNFPTHPIYDTASDYEFEAIYENGVKMIVSSKVKGGVTYEGSQGWVWANRGVHDASSAEIKNSVIGDKELHLYKSDDHFRNFIDGVLTRKECVAPCEVAHRSITICHLGNIAMRLNRNELRWDPKNERILGDSEASAMLDRPYRQGYELPTEL